MCHEFGSATAAAVRQQLLICLALASGLVAFYFSCFWLWVCFGSSQNSAVLVADASFSINSQNFSKLMTAAVAVAVALMQIDGIGS